MNFLLTRYVAGERALLCDNSINHVVCSELKREGDLLAELYDVRYNGSLTFTVGGGCPTATRTTDYIYQLRIGNVGPIPGTNVSRELWDDNPFWMGLYVHRPTGVATSGDTFGHMMMRSSSSLYIYSKYWQLSASKLGDGSGYSVSGELVAVHWARQHELDFQYKCGGPFKSYGERAEFMIKNCNADSAVVNGTVKKDSAEVTFYIVPGGDKHDPAEFSFAFSGERIPGPELVSDGDAPAATGAFEGAEEVIAESPFKDGSGTEGRGGGEDNGGLPSFSLIATTISVPVVAAIVFLVAI